MLPVLQQRLHREGLLDPQPIIPEHYSRRHGVWGGVSPSSFGSVVTEGVTGTTSGSHKDRNPSPVVSPPDNPGCLEAGFEFAVPGTSREVPRAFGVGVQPGGVWTTTNNPHIPS